MAALFTVIALRGAEVVLMPVHAYDASHATELAEKHLREQASGGPQPPASLTMVAAVSDENWHKYEQKLIDTRALVAQRLAESR